MFVWKKLLSMLALAAAFCSATAPAVAVTVTYSATDVADVVSGVDRWSVQYRLSGSFQAFEGINVLYPATQYAGLDMVVAPDAGTWSVLITQPDSGLPVDGFINVSPFVNVVANDVLFTVEFDWLGSGTPGSQGYEIFDANFTVTGTGNTVTPSTNPPPTGVPEPSTLALLVGALTLLGARARKA